MERDFQCVCTKQHSWTFPCAMLVCLAHTVCMHLWDECVHFTRKTVTVSPFSPFLLHCLDSEPPGMIINLIIKHLLPTAPALFPPDPPGPHHRERDRERERGGGEQGMEGGTQEEPEGGVGGRRAANPKGSSSHCWILLHRWEAVFFCVVADSVWSYVIPEQKKQGGRNNPMLGKNWRESQRGAPPQPSLTSATNLSTKLDFFLFIF